MSKINFDFALLEKSLVEKDVENAYRTLFSKLFTKYGLTSPFGCDGHLTDDNGLDVLCEFKYDNDLKSKIEQVKILIQQLYYLKKFEKSGTKLPKVLFVGDINECFAIHTNPLTKYLNYSLDWSIAPSNAHKQNPELIQEMVNDDQINPFVFDLNRDFVWGAISRKLVDLSTNVKRLIKVIDTNIVQVFEYFCNNVLDSKCKLNAHDKASLFISRLINDKDIYLHPKKTGCLITKDFGEIKVNEKNYVNFFNHFDGSQYSIREKEELVKIVDRIVDDVDRRRNGDFFTPTIWVDEAHKMISEQFGEDWKEKYVVWDCAWGTGNLTRDYKFGELYCSTLHQSEIDVANANRVNPESVKFQYDFLNDGIVDGKIDVENDTKLPQGLKDAILGGKEIIFLINPPYGSVQSFDNIKQDGGKSKNKIEDTLVKQLMNKDNMGLSVKNLYTQFLYKIIKYNKDNIKICLFSPPLFLTGSDSKLFRNKFLSTFSYKTGMLFDASNFADVSSWGLSFTIFDNDETKINNIFKINVVELDNNSLVVNKLYDKYLYNLDDVMGCNEWVRQEIKGIKPTVDLPKLSSALSVKQKGYSNLIPGAFGYFYSNGNNIYYNGTNVSLFTSCFSGKSGLSINNDNYIKCISLFTARKTIKPNWINQKDEYIAPTPEIEQSEKFKQFQYDSIVYSLFNTSSNQSSMRQVDYKGKKWDIKNEFFWMSKDQMMELADMEGFDDLYYDAKDSENRYVYRILFEEGIYNKLSPDAKEVLDLSIELVKKSFSMRKTISEQKPEYHLNTWDAGWYQIKKVAEDYFKLDYVKFISKYKAFEDRMRPQVYELGFLKK